MKLIVTEGLLRHHIAEGLSGNGDDPVLDVEYVGGRNVAFGIDVEDPTGEVLPVEKLRLALPAGSKQKDGEGDGCDSFHRTVYWFCPQTYGIFPGK